MKRTLRMSAATSAAAVAFFAVLLAGHVTFDLDPAVVVTAAALAAVVALAIGRWALNSRSATSARPVRLNGLHPPTGVESSTPPTTVPKAAPSPLSVAPLATARRTRLLERQSIIDRHARLSRNGIPTLCFPSRLELSGKGVRKERPGTDGKIIYDSREAAEACARDLEAAGYAPQYAYTCGRSKHGHHHLTTTLPTPRKAANGE